MENQNPAVPFSISIDPKQVEELVVRSVMESAIGERVKVAIQDALNKQYSTDNSIYGSKETLIEQAVKAEVKKTIATVIHETLQLRRDEIRAQISEYLTNEVIMDTVDKMWSMTIKQLEKINR